MIYKIAKMLDKLLMPRVTKSITLNAFIDYMFVPLIFFIINPTMLLMWILLLVCVFVLKIMGMVIEIRKGIDIEEYNEDDDDMPN